MSRWGNKMLGMALVVGVASPAAAELVVKRRPVAAEAPLQVSEIQRQGAPDMRPAVVDDVPAVTAPMTAPMTPPAARRPMVRPSTVAVPAAAVEPIVRPVVPPRAATRPVVALAPVVESDPSPRSANPIFRLQASEVLQASLRRWCKAEGWNLEWKARYDVPIDHPYVFPAGTTFRGAVGEVMESLWHGPNALVASLYPEHRVLVIDAKP